MYIKSFKETIHSPNPSFILSSTSVYVFEVKVSNGRVHELDACRNRSWIHLLSAYHHYLRLDQEYFIWNLILNSIYTSRRRVMIYSFLIKLLALFCMQFTIFLLFHVEILSFSSDDQWRGSSLNARIILYQAGLLPMRAQCVPLGYCTYHIFALDNTLQFIRSWSIRSPKNTLHSKTKNWRTFPDSRETLPENSRAELKRPDRTILSDLRVIESEACV